MKFVGLSNFQKLIEDPIIYKALLNNLYFLFWGTITILTISLFFAVVLARGKFTEKGFYRVVFFFPNVLSLVVVGILWMFVYNPSFGILNAFLELIGLESLIKVWLGDSSTVMAALVVPQAWISIGFYMILYIAAIQNIPESYFEAAIIDGAGQIKQLFLITIPMMWEVVRVSLIFLVINAFTKTFAIVYVTTKGGPFRSSELLTTYMYEQAYENSDFGYGTTIGITLFLIVFIISTVVLKFTKREVNEY
jgi:N-acetylglucosamine transport system permease protein